MNIKSNTKKLLKLLESISDKPLTFGNMLWAIRMADETTQVEMANKLGVSKQYLSDIENGRRLVSPKSAAEYAKKLKYAVSQFVRLSLQDMLDRDGIKYQVELK